MTAIEWTDVTWNPVTGCSKVSPGCAHCYAERQALGRLKGSCGYPGLPWTPGNAETNVVLRPERLNQPLRWRKPRMVFVNSMSDLFHERIPDDFIAAVYAVMTQTPQHTFQVLTKRPARMAALVGARGFIDLVQQAVDALYDDPDDQYTQQGPWPPLNVWLGTSIENPRFVGRADALRDTRAAVRFISAEPLLGPLVRPMTDARSRAWSGASPMPDLDLTGIDWLIVGGESGPRARRIDADWARDLRNAARATICPHCAGLGRGSSRCGEGCLRCGNRGTETAFFFKQWGGPTPRAGGRELDGRTWDEMPVTTAATEAPRPRAAVFE